MFKLKKGQQLDVFPYTVYDDSSAFMKAYAYIEAIRCTGDTSTEFWAKDRVSRILGTKWSSIGFVKGVRVYSSRQYGFQESQEQVLADFVKVELEPIMSEIAPDGYEFGMCCDECHVMGWWQVEKKYDLEGEFYIDKYDDLVFNGEAPKTEEDAWEISFQKWRNLVKHPVADGAAGTCGLCMLYYKSGSCDGCPIAMDGHRGCRRTPYVKYERTSETAQAELEYLEDLYERTHKKDGPKTVEFHFSSAEIADRFVKWMVADGRWSFQERMIITCTYEESQSVRIDLGFYEEVDGKVVFTIK